MQPIPEPRVVKTIPDQVADRLRGAILAREYEPGDALPPERHLAESMGTNRTTLREAVRRLEETGLVRVRQGHGVRVLDYRADGRLHLLPAFLAAPGVPLAERLQVLVDALRVRTLFLSDAASQAAERRTAADLDALRSFLATPLSTDAAIAMRQDLAFYRALVEAAKTQLGVWGYNTFAPAITAVVGLMPDLWIPPPRYQATLGAVIDAIAAGDSARAHEALEEHLASSDAAVADALNRQMEIP